MRIELIANGEQSGTWGQTTNNNLGTLIEDAVSGYVSVSVIAADQALTALNGVADQSRNMIIDLTTTTTANFNVYIPPADKFYVIRNSSVYDATIYCSTVIGNTTAAGTGVTIPALRETLIFADGTNVASAIDYIPVLTLGAALALTSGGTGATTASGARTNLGLGTIATQNANAVAITGGSITGITDLAVADGGTGASDAATARSNLSVPSTTGSGASGTWNISISGNAATATTATTATTANALNTGNNYQINSLGVGAAATGVAGEIVATDNITAYYSDERLKTKLGNIENALDKLCSLEGFYYEANETAQALGYEAKREVGISAQKMQQVLPEIVAPAPIDNTYLTVRYERALPLIVEAIKELRAEVESLKKGV